MSHQSKAETDRVLLEDALDALERFPCQFIPCDGPTLRPVAMLTCVRCATVARLQKRLGRYISRKQRKATL